jgi:plasmanylethanolamine desaturase
MTEKGTRRKDAVELAAGYTKGHRAYEIGGMLLASVLATGLLVRLAQSPRLSGWLMPLAALLGILSADFISGFVHWLFDTWGGVDTPVVGKLAIRTFREHHVDAKSITRHDFIETNGHNITLSVLPLTGGLYLLRGEAALGNVFCAQWLLSMAAFVAMTSQIHKWAHMDTPPRGIAMLQRARLILTAKHHEIHHTAPYENHYCITVGWLNQPLAAVRFFRILERVITAVTGALPRADDIGEKAAQQVFDESVTEAKLTDVPEADAKARL